MTPTSPTWGDVEEFLATDGWRRLPGSARGGKRQTRIFFEKQLPDGQNAVEGYLRKVYNRLRETSAAE